MPYFSQSGFSNSHLTRFPPIQFFSKSWQFQKSKKKFSLVTLFCIRYLWILNMSVVMKSHHPIHNSKMVTTEVKMMTVLFWHSRAQTMLLLSRRLWHVILTFFGISFGISTSIKSHHQHWIVCGSHMKSNNTC